MGDLDVCKTRIMLEERMRKGCSPGQDKIIKVEKIKEVSVMVSGIVKDAVDAMVDNAIDVVVSDAVDGEMRNVSDSGVDSDAENETNSVASGVADNDEMNSNVDNAVNTSLDSIAKCTSCQWVKRIGKDKYYCLFPKCFMECEEIGGVAR